MYSRPLRALHRGSMGARFLLAACGMLTCIAACCMHSMYGTGWLAWFGISVGGTVHRRLHVFVKVMGAWGFTICDRSHRVSSPWLFL